MVLAAYFLLQALGDSVQVALLAAHLRRQENAVRMLHDAGTHLHDPFEFSPPRRLENIPHPLYVDEKGILIVLDRILITEIGGEIDDALHALQGPVDGVEIGHVTVDLLPLPVAVATAIHLPGGRVVVQRAHLMAAGEVFQHRPANPAGSANDCYFHKSSSKLKSPPITVLVRRPRPRCRARN